MSKRQHHFAIGVVNISLRSDRLSFIDEYLSLYEPYVQDSVGAQAIEVEIKSNVRYPWRRGPFILRSEGVEDFRVDHHYEVLPHLEWFINAQIIRNRNNFLQFHASSLAIDGQALILAGDPGSGKTTLTAGLLTQGWSYLCDEFALVDPQTHLIHPYPRALCIKEGSFSVIQRLCLPLHRKTPYQKATKGCVGFMNPLDVRADVVGKPTAVRFVIFPKYVSGQAPALHAMTRSEAVDALARQCFNARVFQDRLLPVIADLVRGAECYRLTCGDIAATCGLVQQLVRAETLNRKRCA